MRIIDKTHCKEVIILRYYDPRSEESLKNLTEGFVRKGGRKTLRVGGKVLKKSILMMVKAFGLPFVLIFGVIILVVAISSYALFGERGSMSEYNVGTTHTNEIIYTETEDYIKPIAADISNENNLVELYYKFMAIQSYYKTIDGGNTLLSFADDTDKFVKYTDYHGKENFFYLNNYFLLSLDEIANEYLFKYPEQFIKPVYADLEHRKLKDLVDEDGNLVAESIKYKDGLPTGEKTEGAWDYGFAPILYYKEYEKKDYVKGVYTSKDIQVGNTVVNVKTEEPFRVEIPRTNKPVYVIETAITQSGDVNYVYEQQDMFLRNLKDGSSSNEYADVTRYRYDTAYIEYVLEDGTIEIEEVPLYKYRMGTVVEYIPVEKSSTENLSGIKYLKDYLSNYEAYVPKGVMTDFNFSDRAEEKEEIINKLSVLNVFAGVNERTRRTSIGSIQTSSKIESDPYNKSYQYFSMFRSYADQFGLDPYLLVAIGAQESGGEHQNYLGSKGAVGLMQIEPPKSFLVETADGDEIRISVDRKDLTDVKTNIKTGAAYLKHCIDYFNGNILMGLQAYNFGPTGTKNIVERYAIENGKTYKQVRDNQEDLGWMNYRKYYTNGGDDMYVEHVLSYYAKSITDLTGIETTETTEDFDAISAIDLMNEEYKNRSWLKKAWDNISQGFKSLVADVRSIFRVEYSESSNYHVNKMGETDIDSILSQTLAFSNYSDYYSSYDDVINLMSEDNLSTNFLFLGNASYYGGIGGAMEYVEGIASELEDFINPTLIAYRITSPFGPRIDPISYTPSTHNGTDYATPLGTPLYAVTDGIISFAGYKNSYGNIVELEAGDYHIKYAHMSEIIVRAGQAVKRGQLVGYSGKSGYSTGPHLHFEVIRKGQRINPALYFYK